MNKNYRLAVVGLGYVGLPLALEFGKKFSTIGVDQSTKKIESYKKCFDPTGEISRIDFKNSKKITFTNSIKEINLADIIIVSVPTPVTKYNKPDLQILKDATKEVAQNMKKKSIIVFESTVYPGTTEEVCVPILEKYSGFKWLKDFYVGYSPERVNPGDKKHTITHITKVVSGDSKNTLEKLARIYSVIIKAGVYKSPSIKVAEAAKVIENTQRDLNIALMNELSSIFDLMSVDTSEVLKAASTKWNFLPFTPGLVGGHCIGVDPYYLTFKAKKLGHKPKLILSGREVNDNIPKEIASKVSKLLKSSRNKKIIFLGTTFKEDCSDIRNSKSIELLNRLKKIGFKVYVHDPLSDKSEIKKLYGISLLDWNELPNKCDAIVISVAHKFYKNLKEKKIFSLLKKNAVVFDIKSIYQKRKIEKLGHKVWSL
tara:strand:+ start:147 stop:1427 length:1281 start_codon:yes stop_codon:yes gene_type:complete